jgi:hypothetical protein
MSVAGILEAMRSPRPLAERLVWQCLENHANGARFWPMSEEAIAKELSLGLNTVSRAVQALVAANIVRTERHKRRPTVFYMLRDYGKPNGQHPPHEEDLPPQNDGSTEHLTPQNGDPTPELTPQNDGSSRPRQLELTPHDGGTSPDLTPQNGGTSYPPVKNPPERKEEPPTPQAGGGVSRAEGTNPRSEGTNPRKLGENPRAVGANPRVNESGAINPPWFDAFWDLYPRKVGKRTAAAAFVAAVNRGNEPAAIVQGLRGYTFHADPQFQPHPTTWLRGDRWLDEVDSFDPVLRAAGLRPEDFLDAPPGGLLQ